MVERSKTGKKTVSKVASGPPIKVSNSLRAASLFLLFFQKTTKKRKAPVSNKSLEHSNLVEFSVKRNKVSNQKTQLCSSSKEDSQSSFMKTLHLSKVRSVSKAPT